MVTSNPEAGRVLPILSPAPLVSVGMPVFNGESYLAEAIESVLSQTLTDLELIISDNASTDRTPEICAEYAARDPRIRYVRNTRNLGGAENFNNAFRLARGSYFKWLACDDLIRPGFLEKCIAALQANPRAVLAYAHAAMIDQHGHKIHDYEGATTVKGWSRRVHERYRRFMREITGNYSITVPIYVHGVVPRKVLAETHLQRHYLCQDDNLVAELILKGEVCEVPDTLKLIRYHPGSSGWIPHWQSSGKFVQQWYRPDEGSVIMRVFRWSWRHRLEYIRLVLTADATPGEKLAMMFENFRAIPQRLRGKSRLIMRRLRGEEITPWQRY